MNNKKDVGSPELGSMGRACDFNTWEIKARGSGIQCQLHKEFKVSPSYSEKLCLKKNPPPRTPLSPKQKRGVRDLPPL